MTDSQNLLAEYAQTGSDAAFRELVTRYVDLVYWTAFRLVESDAHRAEDVAQTVFVDLTRLARTLSNDVMLGGWLHRHTCFVAANTMRSERRRRFRERQAVEMNALQDNAGADFSLVAPILDEAINELGEEDRKAVLLRFFEQQDFRSLGQALGSTEDAARMRVARALDKLQGMLKHRGVTTSSATLSLVLAANAIQAAPAGLAVTISTAAALAGTAVQTSTAVVAAKTIAMTTIQKTLIAAALAVAAGTGIFETRQASKLRNQVQALQQQQAPLTEQIQQLQQERDAATNQLASLTEKERSKRNSAELLRLRSETGALRARLAAKESDYEKLALESIRGQFRLRTDWSDKGNQDPFTAVETMLWAFSQKQQARLEDVATPQALTETRWPIFPKEHPPIQTVGAVNLIDSLQNQKGTRAVVTAFVREDFAAPPGGSPYSVNKLQGWQLIKDDGGWKISKEVFFDTGHD